MLIGLIVSLANAYTTIIFVYVLMSWLPNTETGIVGDVYRVLGTLYREEILSDAETLYNTKEVQKILPVLSYVNANFTDNLTLEDVSAKLGFDRSYFCRVFKLATGATFTEYLNYVRVCKAEHLLQHSDESIISISESVGFSSVSYFNRVFKKYRNCSPRAFRAVICYKM